MKRPLALFGGVYLLVMLAAVLWVPAAVLMPAAVALPAAFLLCAALVCQLVKRRGIRAPLAIALAAAGLALAVNALHYHLVMQPVQALAGQELRVTARVTEASPGGFEEDTITATLQVLALEGEALARPFSVSVYGLPAFEVGDEITLPLAFYETAGQWQAYNHAKGFYVGARVAGEAQKTGQSLTFLCRVRRLQYALSANIQSRLPQRLSGVSAAMSLGDKRLLPAAVKSDYRAAGLSHVLVVSGMHLSILCGLLYALARKVTHRQGAALVCMAFIAVFMAFTGFSPSVVRSGFAFLMVYAAQLFRRKADVFTSLGLAAVLLCTQNPNAAADAGLLLSFSATLGVLLGGNVQQALKRKAPARQGIRAVPQVLARSVVVPLCTTFATFPVLLLFGFGVSLFTLPANLLAVPLLAPIVLSGFVTALPAVPVLGQVAGAAALVNGGLLVLLEKLTQFCASFRFAYVYVGGTVAAAILLLYLLALCAWKSRRVKAYLLAGLVVLSMGVFMQVALTRGVVYVAVVGSGSASSVVVMQNGQAVVLYRDRRTLDAVQQAMWWRGVSEVALLVDMRQTSSSTEYISALSPQRVVVPALDIISRQSYAAFENTEVFVARQAGGLVACVDVAGYKIGVTTGSVNLAPYTAVDVLAAGRGAVQGSYNTLLALGAPPEWAAPQGEVLSGENEAGVAIRPGTSVRFWEVENGGFEG